MQQLTQLEQTLEMLKLAKTKGFNMEQDIKPPMFEYWMNAESAFCNTACAIVALWLRNKHIQVAVNYRLFGQEELYRYEVTCFTVRYKPELYNKSYEEAWIKGITEALNLLPAAQEI